MKKRVRVTIDIYSQKWTLDHIIRPRGGKAESLGSRPRHPSGEKVQEKSNSHLED